MNEQEQFYEHMRQIAEGQLRCACGNTEWRHFLYIGDGTEYVRAGCKKCGTIYTYDNREWQEVVKGPGR